MFWSSFASSKVISWLLIFSINFNGSVKVLKLCLVPLVFVQTSSAVLSFASIFLTSSSILFTFIFFPISLIAFSVLLLSLFLNSLNCYSPWSLIACSCVKFASLIFCSLLKSPSFLSSSFNPLLKILPNGEYSTILLFQQYLA